MSIAVTTEMRVEAEEHKALQIAEETIDSGFQAIEALSDLVLAIDRSIFAQQRAENIFSHVNAQLIQARRVIAVIEQRRKELK